MSAAPLSAQDGLSEEEQALVQRFIDAYSAVLTLNSYTGTSTVQETQDLQVASDGVVVNQENSTTDTQTTSTIIRGDSPSGVRVITETTTDDDGMRTIEVELRYVDGITYASGNYTAGTGELVFPAGFTQIDPESPGVFEEYDVDSFVDEVLGQFDSDDPLNLPEVLMSMVDSATLRSDQLDGAPVEIITLAIPANRLISASLQADPNAFGDPETAAVLENVSAESIAIVDLYIDSEGRAIRSDSQFLFEIKDLSAAQIEPTAPAGLVLNITTFEVDSESIGQFNAELPAITAP